MFSNKKETVITTEKSSKRDLISSEIKSLGKIKEDLLLEIEKFKKESEDYNDISLKLLEAEKEFNNLNKEIGSKKNMLSEFIGIDIKVKEKEILLSDLKMELEHLENKKSDLEKNISKLNSDYELNISNLKEKVLLIDKEVSDKNKDLSVINYDTTKAKNIYNDTINEISSNVNVKNSELEYLNSEINKKIEDLNKINENIISSKNDFDSVISDKNKLVEEADNYYSSKVKEGDDYKKSKEQEILSWQGSLSDKENWLKTKEAELIELKSQMEAFHGKKINSINI